MDDKTRLFLWVLLGGVFFALLGAAFGGLTGAVTWRNGRPAGTFLGLRVARAFTRASGEELTPTATGALVGAVDGLAFLGAIGLAVGYFAGSRHPAEWESLRPAFLAGGLLAAGGVFFGTLAYALVAGGTRAVACLFTCAVAGAFTGYYLGGVLGVLVGTVAGAVAGTALGLVRR